MRNKSKSKINIPNTIPISGSFPRNNGVQVYKFSLYLLFIRSKTITKIMSNKLASILTIVSTNVIKGL